MELYASARQGSRRELLAVVMQLRKVIELLKTCPTCGEDLVQVPGSSIMQCLDLYHGRFVIEQTTKGNFFITYEPKKQAIV